MSEHSQSHKISLEAFEEQYKRIFEAAGCRTQVELATMLEIKQSSISDAKKRSSLPPDWLIKLLRLKSINPEWVLTGEGSRFLQSADFEEIPVHIRHIVKVKPLAKCSAQELINELVRRALHQMS